MILSLALPFAYWGLTLSTWLVMWTVLGLITILIFVLLNTRWANKRTWQKCAILSLWVHVLFAFLALTVRIITGAPETGEETPIRVAMLPVETASEAEEPEEEIQPDWERVSAPPLLAPAAKPLTRDNSQTAEQPLQPDPAELESLLESKTKELTPAVVLEAPSLLMAPTPLEIDQEEVEDQAEQNETLPAEKSTPTELADQMPDAEGGTEANEVDQSQPESLTEVPLPPPLPTPKQSHLPNSYEDRFALDRAQIALRRGGSEQTEKAVRAALGWLAEAQSTDGGWDASKYGAGHERAVLGHNRGGAGTNADTAVTGLALLAFLGHGNSHHHGSYRAEIARGLEYLRQRQRSDGSLYGEAELFARTYCHSMATLAVCEAFAITNDARLEHLARSATAYSLALQHPTDGGWRYRRGDTGDTSQLGWQLMALKSAELAGINVPEVTWTRIERFLRKVSRGNAGGLAAYRPDGPASRTMTAEAWFCHQLLRNQRGTTFDDPCIQEAVKSLLEELPSANNRNLYYWYYATLALQQNQGHSPTSAAAWESWNQALTSALLTTQASDGSWDANTVWGGYGGRVYTTALSALCLEVYYRYRPLDEPGEIADREDWRSLQR